MVPGPDQLLEGIWDALEGADEAKARAWVRDAAKALQGDPVALLDLYEDLVREFGESWEEVYRLARAEARRVLSRRGLAEEDRAAALTLSGLCAVHLGEPARGLPALDEALALRPEDPVALRERGEALLLLWRFEEALPPIAHAAAALPGDPHAQVLHAYALERADRREEARGAFAQAEAIDPEGYPVPLEVPKDAFDALVLRAVEGLPAPMHGVFDEVRLVVEDFPDPRHLGGDRGDHSPFLLGLYVGTSMGERSVFDVRMEPDRIHVFQRNLEYVCRTRGELVREVERTVLHEVAHLIGYTETRMDEIENGWSEADAGLSG